MKPQPARIIGEVLVNGVPMPVKFCVTCGIQRPLRASHCRETNRCIHKWDHFCPWLGNSVGKRNYPFFVGFVAFTWLHATLVGFSSVTHLRRLTSSLTRTETLQTSTALLAACRDSPSAVVLIIYCLIAGLMLTLLLTYHFYLISINQTTYENVRAEYLDRPNPFERGCVSNWAEVLGGCCLCTWPAAAEDLHSTATSSCASDGNHGHTLQREAGSSGGGDAELGAIEEHWPDSQAETHDACDGIAISDASSWAGAAHALSSQSRNGAPVLGENP
uniref:Palmitoyltransferase n=1 Tax=Calcidiscus leptoporus TaxID=127549 RepID=A0A7S0J8C9_9EUKA